MKDKLIQLWKGLSEADITEKYSENLSIKKHDRNRITVSLDEKIFEFQIKELPKEVNRTSDEPLTLIELDSRFWLFIDRLEKRGLKCLNKGDFFLTEDNIVITNDYHFTNYHIYYDRGFKKKTAWWYNFPFGKKPTYEYVTVFPASYDSTGFQISFGNFVSAHLTDEEYNTIQSDMVLIEEKCENDIVNQLLELIK